MHQLIATDLDGTILFDRKVSPADLDAMRRWRAAGNLLVVDTGKSVFATRDTFEPLGVVFDYAVAFTGVCSSTAATACCPPASSPRDWRTRSSWTCRGSTVSRSSPPRWRPITS